eukprot:CAMPEP_0196825988 /NCGR_PEP_ID=MMETSP1362-20130617/93381_1 /TAXON_ID=163516 /ORGANISM="Leptocylindrus danicus, Strain CCMP1856" /LENGTH=285 /DNA_ID=CAMNT_0042206517 /DNA_START=670 /DNA_END=1528 /DNA_ORIENTATION=+
MISLTLDFSEYGKTESKMFAMAESIIEILATKPITYNNHAKGIQPESLEADEGANNMFVITSTSVARDGLRFVASIEPRDFDTYPYFGVQFRPEKHAFEQSAIITAARVDVNNVAESIIEILATKPITYNNHAKGIQPESLEADEGANDMFVITSTSVARDGLRFVASIEARDFDTYPYFGVQFRPEKHAFEQSAIPGTDIPFNPAIDHSEDAILASNALLKNFISEARKSTHMYKDIDRFPLIWNYETGQGLKYEQVYFFRKTNQQQQLEGGKSSVVTNLRGSL